jgi:hypothetical protein
VHRSIGGAATGSFESNAPHEGQLRGMAMGRSGCRQDWGKAALEQADRQSTQSTRERIQDAWNPAVFSLDNRNQASKTNVFRNLAQWRPTGHHSILFRAARRGILLHIQ